MTPGALLFAGLTCRSATADLTDGPYRDHTLLVAQIRNISDVLRPDRQAILPWRHRWFLLRH